MSAVAETLHDNLEVAPEFFAPSNFDALDTLLDQYEQEHKNIEAVDAFLRGKEMQSAVRYFFSASERMFNRYVPSVENVFNIEAAHAALNASYWQRALSLTDVIECMPDERRQEWSDLIREHKTPEFEEGTVRATLESLLAQRLDFFAEMVDGIFRGLSGEHVTNSPEGFNRRMIIQGALVPYGIGHRAGLIHDLRCVIARFMGREQPRYNLNHQLLEHCRRYIGEWNTVDGGSLRIRVYKNGNAHLEVHPDISWRLNQILAHRYPQAIPSRFRKRPTRVRRDFVLMERPIPFAVLGYISAGSIRAVDGCFTFGSGYSSTGTERHIVQEAVNVLTALGGTPLESGRVRFDYDPSEIIDEVVVSGMLPDQVSHQFYPTPQRLAAVAAKLAEVEESHQCLEPSAGLGALAEFLPRERTLCVEVSELHCKVLEAKGYDALQKDFLDFDDGRRFDRILMNPPFSQGRAAAHLEHAANLLAPGGRIVAILPASFAGKDVLPGLQCQWSGVYHNKFPGTSVSVVMLQADRIERA